VVDPAHSRSDLPSVLSQSQPDDRFWPGLTGQLSSTFTRLVHSIKATEVETLLGMTSGRGELDESAEGQGGDDEGSVLRHIWTNRYGV
jgi:hypothetical protein